MRLSWLWLVGVAACSPYVFSGEITTVSTGVDQVANGFTAGYASLAADRAAQVQLALTETRAKADIPRSCLVPVGPSPESQAPCLLFTHGSAEPALTAVEQTRDKTMQVLRVLKNYTHALAAVTNAADRAAFDAAVTQLSGAVGGVAKFADAAAPGTSVIAPAAVNLIGWVFGTALDQQRFDSLKTAVNAVGKPGANGIKPMDSVTRTLGLGLSAIDDARRRILFDEARTLRATLGPAMNDSAYRQRLTDSQAMLAVLDGLRKADPSGTATALGAAHDALVDAVNDPSRNYAALLTAVGLFADKAAALQAAFSATPAPAKPAAQKGA